MSEFNNQIAEAVKKFTAISTSKPLKLVSHLDSDGICACSIMADALNRQDLNYSISILHQLREDNIRDMAKESYDVFVFTDLGSGQIGLLNKYFADKTVFVLDHHHPQGKAEEHIVHINPHLNGIDGSKEISGSGVVYYFCKQLNDSQKAHLAVIGAIGDVQEYKGFTGINDAILKEAISQGTVSVQQGLRFFGLQTRPLYKLLEYSTDLGIPGVTGSESGAIQFLKSIGIDPKIGNQWKKISDLNQDEKKNLVAGIIMRRVNLASPEDIFTNVYVLNHEKGVFKDAREFSTVLNACGRMNKASVGIGACLSDKNMQDAAYRVMSEYKREIMKALDWYKNTKDVVKSEKYMILNAKDNIMPTIAGTLGSILSKSNEFRQRFYIMTLARNLDDTTKVSLRIVGNDSDINLKEMILKMIEGIGDSEAGGHQYASGAFIPTEKEDEFIEKAIRIIDAASMEEVVR